MKDIIKKETGKYNLVINNFEGPLDLLVYLISKNKMNIFDISLSELTDKYIEYLNDMCELDLEVTSEFVLMASKLLDLKARKLLPELEPTEEEEEEEQDIIAKLVDYKKYKEVSAIISNMYEEHFGSFTKNPEKIKIKSKKEYNLQNLDVIKLNQLYSDLLQRRNDKINLKAKEISKIAVYERITVKDKVNQICDYFKYNDSMLFNEIFNVNECSNLEVVTAFLGVLELSKLKQVSLLQQNLFSDIEVNKSSNMQENINLSEFFE